MPDRPFAGQVAIVTGGTVGIGRATALALADAGAHVVVVGRHPERVAATLDAVARRAGPDALGLAADVRREGDMADMARRTVERFGRIDVLVASAGILRPAGGALRTLAEMTEAEWEEVVETNLTGLFLSNRAVLPAMTAQRGGQIINVSSTSGRRGYAFDTAYCATKYAAIGLSQALAEEVRGLGIRVQTVLPGAIATPMWGQNGPLGAPAYALPAERVADVILYMLALPEDTVLVEPAVEPLARPAAAGWRDRAGPARAAVASGAA